MISQAINFGKSQCALGGSDSGLLDAQLLLQYVLNCDRQYLYMHPQQRLTDDEWQQYRGLITQRREGRPVAHLLGHREFWTLNLSVNNSTLIPRPDTEILVEQALLLDLPANARVLELGTGTGAVALALASERPSWRVYAVDLAADAVALAIKNRDKHGLERVEIWASNWFSEVIPSSETEPGFDLIISNPPYIDSGDPHLQEGDVRFEPSSALVAGEQGYADLRTIIGDAPGFLNADGWVMLEHGYTQGAKVRAIFTEKGYQKVNTAADYASLDRVSYAQWAKFTG